MSDVIYAHEAPRRLRVAFLGTSGHAFRNFIPALPYAPVELVGLWDPDPERAAAVGGLFGAPRTYDDLDRLFAECQPDATLIGVEGYDGNDPRGLALVRRSLEAGCHVWADKPVAADVASMRSLIGLRDRVGRVAAVGIKTMYYPAYQRVREIVRRPEFGAPMSMSVRYPLRVPGQLGLPLDDPSVRSCLGHVWHPFGAALLVLGPPTELEFRPSRAGQGGVALAAFRGGAVGSFHFSAGQSGTSPLERLEIVGDGANVIVENAIRVTHYRNGSPGPYGRTATFLTPDDEAPLVWEPEFSLGQLYNTNNFLQGYAPSIIDFAEAALAGSEPAHGTLEDAVEVLRCFEGLRSGELPPADDHARLGAGHQVSDPNRSAPPPGGAQRSSHAPPGVARR